LRSFCVQSNNAGIGDRPRASGQSCEGGHARAAPYKLRLYFAFAGLYCLKFALQSCSAVLRLLRKAARDFSNLILKDHGAV
jgi:hypothetical protein